MTDQNPARPDGDALRIALRRELGINSSYDHRSWISIVAALERVSSPAGGVTGTRDWRKDTNLIRSALAHTNLHGIRSPSQVTQALYQIEVHLTSPSDAVAAEPVAIPAGFCSPGGKASCLHLQVRERCNDCPLSDELTGQSDNRVKQLAARLIGYVQARPDYGFDRLLAHVNETLSTFAHNEILNHRKAASAAPPVRELLDTREAIIQLAASKFFDSKLENLPGALVDRVRDFANDLLQSYECIYDSYTLVTRRKEDIDQALADGAAVRTVPSVPVPGLDTLLLPRELSDEEADAALRATAVWLEVKGSQLTVNREKMKARYRNLVKYIETISISKNKETAK